jgi:SOS response regulatory protein OraA/RecX
VAVELDGRPWRTIPEDAVVRSGLRAGIALDRPLARELARELRQAKALGAATRALRARPLSEQRLRERLRAKGIPDEAERAAVATLSAAGYVDDARLARGRALALAERGWGDAAIAARLSGEGLPAGEIDGAVAELEPETARAARLLFGKDPRKGWGLLQRRGFDLETIEAVLGPLDESVAEGLG